MQLWDTVLHLRHDIDSIEINTSLMSSRKRGIWKGISTRNPFLPCYATDVREPSLKISWSVFHPNTCRFLNVNAYHKTVLSKYYTLKDSSLHMIPEIFPQKFTTYFPPFFSDPITFHFPFTFNYFTLISPSMCFVFILLLCVFPFQSPFKHIIALK